MDLDVAEAKSSRRGHPLEVLAVFTRLGLTSFGGPVAHLGYFRDEFVHRRRWLDDRAYADLVALCQFLPGPASSQVGLAIGLSRAGYLGSIAAWIGFTLPSAILLILFAYGLAAFGDASSSGWLHGMKVAAVAVVANAVWSMAQTLAPDRERATLAVVAAIIALAMPTVAGQLAAIGLGAIIGLILLRSLTPAPASPDTFALSGNKAAALLCLTAFFALLAVLPIAAANTDSRAVDLFDAFYRSGSLVFGGGHVVLPLLQTEVVPPGWIDNDSFLAGYGAAQAVPGPLFTFAAYLGAVIGGWPTAILCLVAIFLPSFLLVFGALPFWETMRTKPLARAALTGVNAAVVGLLLAALYNPVWTSGVKSAADFGLALAAFLLLVIWQAPPWLVVALSAMAGAALTTF